MQNWNIYPYKGVDNILFGDSRCQIRNILSNIPCKEFWKTTDSKNSTDQYDSIGILIYYTSDNICEAIEFYEPASPFFDRKNLLRLSYKSLIGWFKTLDTQIEEDEVGFTSYKLGISCYAPDKEEDMNCLAESILIFQHNYFD